MPYFYNSILIVLFLYDSIIIEFRMPLIIKFTLYYFISTLMTKHSNNFILFLFAYINRDSFSLTKY